MVKARHGLESIHIRDVLITASIAAGVAIFLRVFVVGTFSIPSHSMENTLLPGDQILVSKLTPWLGSISRGDIVVFNLPDSLRGDKPDEAYIKRVIGMPGDTVSLTPLGITINNHLLPDPPESATPSAIEQARVTIVVPAAHYFLLGDNRKSSWDSRYWGMLPTTCVIGTPLLVYWSRGKDDSTSPSAVRWNRIFHGVD